MSSKNAIYAATVRFLSASRSTLLFTLTSVIWNVPTAIRSSSQSVTRTSTKKWATLNASNVKSALKSFRLYLNFTSIETNAQWINDDCESLFLFEHGRNDLYYIFGSMNVFPLLYCASSCSRLLLLCWDRVRMAIAAIIPIRSSDAAPKIRILVKVLQSINFV